MVISPPKLLLNTTDTHFPHFRSIESEERREARGEKQEEGEGEATSSWDRGEQGT
ncbi:hypothetical protein Sjap_017696 [Stephania japonica]|uniref:Uncharacterized protein n=1 Tax=Stephania japonica TaxID=461633 RepID=A0AAP0I6V8_9MAGN